MRRAEQGKQVGSTCPALVVRDSFQSKGHPKALAKGRSKEESSQEGNSVWKAQTWEGARSKDNERREGVADLGP